jgi:Tfp pilus assembly protein PilN
MPAIKKSLVINLLPQDTFEGQPLGKFLKWALTYGRYIVVFVELFVILAFLSRFKLDRDLTDLHEEISQKQAIIEATYELDENFRNLQTRLLRIKNLEASEISPNIILDVISQNMPSDVYLLDISVSGDRVNLTSVAASEFGFGVFVNNLSQSKKFTNINLGVVSKGGKKKPGIKFNLSAKFVM